MTDEQKLVLNSLYGEHCTTKIAVDGKIVDMVNHPPHYNKPGKIECIKCIEAITDGYSGQYAYLVGQVVKYLYRANNKGYFTQDIKKAKWYMDRLAKLSDKRFD